MFPQISWLKTKIKKNWDKNFVDKRWMIRTALTSSCHRKTLVSFCLGKKIAENAFLTLAVNYHKTVQKKIMPPKTTLNWLFNDIWCYLLICSFDWKFGISQQAVVRGLLYP